jgi:DNA sulfur modification protein DndD
LLEKDLQRSIIAATPQLEKNHKQTEFVRSQIAQFKERASDIKRDRGSDTAALTAVNEYLRGHNLERVSTLQYKRELLEKEKAEQTQANSDSVLLRNQYLVKVAPFIFLKAPIEKTYALIMESVDKGELPSKIKEIFVRELIEEGRCICGNELSSDSDATATLVAFSKHLSLSELSDVAIVGKTTIEEILSEIQEFPQRIESMSIKIDKQESRLEEIRRDLDQIRDDLLGFDLEEINRYEARREELTTRIAEHNLLLAELDKKMREAQQILDDCRKQESIELAKHPKYDTLKRKLALLREIQNVFAKTESIIKGRIRQRVEQKTRDNFLTLIRKEGAFQNVTISDDYTVKVQHAHGFNVINDLSAGEYMILGLAFMSALTSISGFQAPVIIDTPLAKIDDIHRDYITTQLPHFLDGTQLILLVTPTEYDNDKKVKDNLSHYLLPSNDYMIHENETFTISEVTQRGNA